MTNRDSASDPAGIDRDADFLAGQLIGLFTAGMRAVASGTWREQAIRASIYLAELSAVRASEKPGLLHAAASVAMSELSSNDEMKQLDPLLLDAARKGMLLMIDLVSVDGFARGRASQRQRDFQAAVQAFNDDPPPRRRRRKGGSAADG